MRKFDRIINFLEKLSGQHERNKMFDPVYYNKQAHDEVKEAILILKRESNSILHISDAE